MRARADARAPCCAGGERALLVAAKEGREDLVELLLGFKAEVDARDAHGATPLFISARNGHTITVLALLQAGAAVDAKTKENGQTPLIISAYQGHTNTVLALLQAGAAVDAKNKVRGALRSLMSRALALLLSLSSLALFSGFIWACRV